MLWSDWYPGGETSPVEKVQVKNTVVGRSMFRNHIEK